MIKTRLNRVERLILSGSALRARYQILTALEQQGQPTYYLDDDRTEFQRCVEAGDVEGVSALLEAESRELDRLDPEDVCPWREMG